MSFIRWQQLQISQLTYFTNLLMTFSFAALGFLLHLAMHEGENLDCTASALVVTSIIAYFLSLMFGILLAWNRLRDFRLTARIAKERATGDRQLDDKREEVRALGRLSWILVNMQILLFLVASVIAMYVLLVPLVMIL